MKRFYFNLNLSATEYQRYYQGSADRVLVRCHDGRSLSLPASHFRRFVSVDGIRGRFCLTADDRNRLISLERHSV